MIKVRGGGSVIYVFFYYNYLLFIILFGSWGKISTGTLSCFLLHLQYCLFYFTLFF